MTSVLITGAGGLIGRRVVCAAQSAGYEVKALVRKAGRNDHGVIEHDLRLPLADLPPVDWVFHLAGAYAGAGSDELERADLTMAHSIIRWGMAAGVRNWIFASAAEVYGDVRGVATEDAPTRPVIPYGRAKLQVEQLLIQQLRDVPDCRVVILRIGEVYGAESRLNTELAARLKSGFCPWPGSGDVPVSFVHVDDVAQAFLCGAQSAPLGVSVYNVADDLAATWHGFLECVARHCRGRKPVFLPMGLVRFYAACSTSARRLVGREAILTRAALRLITTPKLISNARLKSELGFQPRYPTYYEGLEEIFCGLSHDA